MYLIVGISINDNAIKKVRAQKANYLIHCMFNARQEVLKSNGTILIIFLKLDEI